MKVIVLTGGIGSGKTAAAEFFRERGADVIDLDDVAARAMGPGSPVLDSVVAEFGRQILRPDGSLDRHALAEVCFADADAARCLDEIVHPAVAEGLALMLAELRLLPASPHVVVVEVPLLAEAPDFAELGDMVVAITAQEATRVERAISRGMERSDVLRRARVQAPDSARIVLADVVIPNDATLPLFLLALERFWDEQFGAGRQDG